MTPKNSRAKWVGEALFSSKGLAGWLGGLKAAGSGWGGAAGVLGSSGFSISGHLS
jgi:hypothetical protein